ncbi:transport and Golgi organization protein 1 homolog isoform X2 [Lissotriton helveticus]
MRVSRLHPHIHTPAGTAGNMAAAGRLLCLLAALLCCCWPCLCRKKDSVDRRFSELKRCVDAECSMLLCRGKAVEDFTGPDCRFINFKKGETIYVYYKLTGRSAELWAGSIGSNFGYFPRHLLEINHVYTNEEQEFETDETDFVCFDGGKDNFDNYNVDDLLSKIEVNEKKKAESETKTEDSVQTGSDSEPKSELEEETETNTIEEEITEKMDNVLVNDELGGRRGETPISLVRETLKQQKDGLVSETTDNTEKSPDAKKDDHSIESPKELSQEDEVQYSKDRPQVPAGDISSGNPVPHDDDLLAKEKSEDFKSYTLLDQETYADLKTQIGTTADAVVTDDEMTNHVTSLDHSDADEDENYYEEMQPEEEDEHLTEIPLLPYEQESILVSKESLEPDPSEEEPVDVPETEPSQTQLSTVPDTKIASEAAETKTNEDHEAKKDEQLQTSWGDTIFAIVSGGEHTKDVTDLDGIDSDEDEEEGYVTENSDVHDSDMNDLLDVQETDVEEKEGTTDEDLENVIEKFNSKESMHIEDEDKLDNVEPEKKQVESQDSLNEEKLDGHERVVKMEEDAGDSPEGDPSQPTEEHIKVFKKNIDQPGILPVNREMNNTELENKNERMKVEDDKLKETLVLEETLEQKLVGVEQQKAEELQNAAKIESDSVLLTEELLKPDGGAVAKENEKTDVFDEGKDDFAHLETVKQEPAAEEDHVSETLSQKKGAPQSDIKADAGQDTQEGVEAAGNKKLITVPTIEGETMKIMHTIEKRTKQEVDAENEEIPLSKHNDTVKDESDNETLDGRPTLKDDVDFEATNELLEDENAAHALQSEQVLKNTERDHLAGKEVASAFNPRAEQKTVHETAKDDLGATSDMTETVHNLLDSKVTEYEELSKNIDAVQKEESKSIAAQVKPPVAGFEGGDAKISTDEVIHSSIGREGVDDADGEPVPKSKDVEETAPEMLKDQDSLLLEEHREHELHKSSGINNTEMEPEYSDSVKELQVMRKYLEEKQIERFRKYLGQPNILQVEAMLHDLESELQQARRGNQVQDEIEKALDQILESSETTVFGFVEKLLDEREGGHEELLEKEPSIFDDEAILLDDIQEVAYRLRQKYSTIAQRRPLPTEIRTSEIDSETGKDVAGQEPSLPEGAEQDSHGKDMERPPWFPKDGKGTPQPEISLSEEPDDLLKEETSKSDRFKEQEQAGDASSFGSTDPVEIGVDGIHQVIESRKNTEFDLQEVDHAANIPEKEPTKKGKKRPIWIADSLKPPPVENLRPGMESLGEPSVVESTDVTEAITTGESDNFTGESSGTLEVEQRSTEDSDSVNGIEGKVNEESLPEATIVESMDSIITPVKDTLSPLTRKLVAALPEGMQPGPDFHGIPWTPILITLLAGVFTVVIFFWRTCLSVKSRVYQVNEKQLAEKIKILIQEKADILQKISDYEQKIKEAKQSVKEARKENTDLSTEALELKEVVKGLEDVNQQLGTKVRKLQADLETERKQRMKKQDNILETQKSVEKLQEILAQYSVQLSEVQIALNEAKLSEQKIKSDFHHVQEENSRLKKSKEQLLKEAEGWSERHSELSEQIKLYHKSQKDMEEALAYKENEIEVLSNCIMQLKQIDAFCDSEPQADEDNSWDKGGGDLANGDCPDKRNEKMKTQIRHMMDVSRVKTTLAIVEEDRDILKTKLNDEISNRHELEEQIEKLEHGTGSLQTAKARLDNECKTLQQKVEILTELYQQKEMALQKKLTQEEYERQEKEQKLCVADEKAVLATEEVKVYKQRIQEMEEELQKTERSYKNQIASHEKKAHDNWLIARSAERTLSEEKRESANLRQKLIEVNQKIAMLQRPSLVKPTPGRPEYQMPGQRGPRSRDGSFGPSPVSGGAPSPPLMMEVSGRPSSTNLNRGREAPRGGMEVHSGPRQPQEISGRMSAPDLGPSRLPNTGPRTSSPSNMVDGLINPGSKGPPSYPGTPIMNSPATGALPCQPPVRFGPPPTRIPYGVRPIAAPLVRGPPMPLGPRDFKAGPPPGMREIPRGPMLPPPPSDAREYARGPLGPPGPYPLGPPPPLLHGPRDYPSGLPRDMIPPGARDYLPGPPPGARNYPGGPPLIPRDYPGGPPPGPKDFPSGPPPGHREFPGGPHPGLRDYPLGPPPGRDFPGGPLHPREYPPGLPQGPRDYQPRPPSGPRDLPPGPSPTAASQRDNENAQDARQ